MRASSRCAGSCNETGSCGTGAGLTRWGEPETVPWADAYSRFLKTLMKEQESLETMFDGLLAQLKELLPDLGRHLAVDSKALQSHARGRKDPASSS